MKEGRDIVYITTYSPPFKISSCCQKSYNGNIIDCYKYRQSLSDR
jgi:hypothetical protein